MFSKPGAVIWSIALASVACAAVALSHFLDQTSEAGHGQALVMLMLAGLAAIASVWRIVRLYRTAAAAADIAQLPVGTVLHPSRARAALVAVAMLAIGALPLLATDQPTPVIRWGAWLFVAVGAAIGAGVAAGVLPAGFLALRAEGLAFGARSAPMLLPWERIRAVEGGEFGGNPAVFLWLDAPETIAVPPGRQRAFMRQVGMCRQLMECDYYLLTSSYSVALPTLVAAIAQHSAARRPATRQAG